MELGCFAARSSSIGSFLVGEDLGDLVQVGIDVVGQPFELVPPLAKFWRLVRGSQQVTAFPLNVIHDTTPIETAMQT
jgi:hypothetical protein